MRPPKRTWQWFVVALTAVGLISVVSVLNLAASGAAPSESQPLTSATVPTAVQVSSSNSPGGYGEVVLLTATVVPTIGIGIPTGTATFLDGTTVLGSATLDSNGQATLVSSGTLSPGTHPITAAYSGDATYQSSVSPPVDQVINIQGTTLQLFNTQNPAYYGEPVSFIADVSPDNGNVIPTSGTVTFFDGKKTVLGQTSLDSNGEAFFGFSHLLTVGNHTITASYSGNPDFSPSSGAPFTETITFSTSSTTVTSTMNPAALGKTVTLDAEAINDSGSLLTVGSVAFRDDGLLMATVPLAATGHALLDVSNLAIGTHNIVAVYSGVANNISGSTSSILMEKIVPPNNQRPRFTSAATTTFVKGRANNFTVTAAGYPKAHFTKTGTLPNGVTLTSAGVLSGAPTALGSYNFSITASNGVLPNAIQTFTLKVATIKITTLTLGTTTRGSGYSLQLAELGGVAPFTWTITSGVLPAGLKMNAGGYIKGSVRGSVTPGPYSVGISLHDNATPTHNVATATLTLVVN